MLKDNGKVLPLRDIMARCRNKFLLKGELKNLLDDMAMALREAAHRMIDYLPEDKIAYIISMLKGIEGIEGINISEEEPDQLDLLMIQDAKIDNEETTPLDDLVKQLEFSVEA